MARTASRPGARPGRAWRAVLLVAVIAAIVLGSPYVPGPPPAAAQSPATAPPGDELDVVVRSGSGGTFRPGRPVPVRVTVQSNRLFEGELVVAADGGNGASVQTRLPVEVAGGTAKDFALLVVVPQSDSNTFVVDGEQTSVVGGHIDVELQSDGEVRDSSALDLQAREWQEIVGVLPKLAEAADAQSNRTVGTRVGGGDARTYAVPQWALDTGVGALDAAATVLASPDDLQDLAPAARNALVLWVTRGGHLLVLGDDPADLGALPEAWRPTTGGRLPVGAGEVRLVGAHSPDEWDQILDPTPWGSLSTVNAADPMAFDPSFSGGSSALATAMATSLGFSVPDLTTFIGVLFAYAVVAGPVAFWLLGRRGRRTSAWVAVPLVGFALSAAFVVAGRAMRDGGLEAHQTVVEVGPDGQGVATTAVLVGTIGQADRRVDFPPGWVVSGSATGRTAQGQTEVVLDATGLHLPLRLDPGEYRMARATGPVEVASPLTVEAHLDGSGADVVGTVRNAGTTTMTDVSVFLGGEQHPLGPLGPGEQRSWSVAAPVRFTVTAPGGQAVVVGGSGAAQELWRQVAAETAGTTARWGLVTVTGVVADAPAPISVDGAPVDAGEVRYVVRTPVALGTPAPDADIRAGIDVTVVRGSDLRSKPDPRDPRRINGSMVRVAVPPELVDVAGAGRLGLDVGSEDVSIFDGTSFVAVTPDRLGRLAVPAGAAVDGVFYLRLPQPDNGVTPGDQLDDLGIFVVADEGGGP